MIYYKVLDGDGIPYAKGSTYDGAELVENQIKITEDEYNNLILAPDAQEPPVQEEPLSVEQQLMITQLQQQAAIDALIVAQLGGGGSV